MQVQKHRASPHSRGGPAPQATQEERRKLARLEAAAEEAAQAARQALQGEGGGAEAAPAQSAAEAAEAAEEAVAKQRLMVEGPAAVDLEPAPEVTPAAAAPAPNIDRHASIRPSAARAPFRELRPVGRWSRSLRCHCDFTVWRFNGHCTDRQTSAAGRAGAVLRIDLWTVLL